MRIHVFGVLLNWDRLARGDGGWAEVYRQAILRVAPGAEVTFDAAPFGAGGAYYDSYARLHPLVRPAGVDVLVVAAWSAGYGAVRTWGRDGLAAADVVACLDAGYASTGPDGRPLPEHVRPWTELARAAIAGGLALVVGASDVPTHPGAPETLPSAPGYSAYGGYESTRELCAAIAASVNLALEPRPGPLVVAEASAGSLLLRYYDGVPGDRGTAEHVAAVHGWGPELVAEGVRLWLGEHPVPSAPPATEPPRSALVIPGSPADEIRAVQADVCVASSRAARGTLLRPADGRWGRQTSLAVSSFQRSAGLPPRNAYGDEERAARAAMPLGIDVSHHQPPIDWQKVRAAGHEFAIVRAAYGAVRDDRAAAHWAGAGAAGLLRMGYLFLRPGMPVSPQVTAAVAALPEAVGWWVDVEPDPLSAGARHTRDEVELAHRMLLATARRTGDYSADSWWSATCKLGPTTRAVWCAGPNTDRLHGGATTWICCQPEVRAVPGVVGDVDFDVWSSRAALSDWSV